MIILGLGSNLSSSYGDRFDNINLATEYLKVYGIKILKKSSFYETPSYPNKKDPKFINIVGLVETHLSPIDLMSLLIFIEEKLERKRNKKNDPRTCDIDILDYKGQIYKFYANNNKLIIPHPRLHKRNFVLFPLFEIEKRWKHPLKKTKIQDLIDKLDNFSLYSIKQI